MPFLSRQVLFKFTSIAIASLVTFAGVMMSIELLQQMQDEASNPKYWSDTNNHFNYQMEQYQACSECTFYHRSVSGGACCRKRLSRKWGPLPPPASRLLGDDFDDSKVRMTPQAYRWHPFLRRTKGFLIDYSKQSNSTHYTYLFPDPVPDPSSAPTKALAPLFGDDYGSDVGIIQWTEPHYTFFAPVTDWVEPPVA